MSGGLDRNGEVPCGEQVYSRRRIAGAHAVRVAPHIVLPVDDVAGGIQSGGQPHRHRRAVGLPGELVVAHPLQLDGPFPGGARDQRRVERDIVGAVLAVAARAFAMTDDDVGGRERQRLREVRAQREHPLRVTPHGELAVLPLRDGARRPDRRVRLERPRVTGIDALHRFRGGLRIGLLVDDRIDEPRALHVLVQGGAGRRQIRRLLPLGGGAQCTRRSDCLFFAFGGDTDKVAVCERR